MFEGGKKVGTACECFPFSCQCGSWYYGQVEKNSMPTEVGVLITWSCDSRFQHPDWIYKRFKASKFAIGAFELP